MSLLTHIKDCIEVFNTTLDGVVDTVNLETIQQATLLFFSTIKSLSLYLITFQWFRDFVCFPLRVPEMSHALLKEHFVSNGNSFNFNWLIFSQPAVSSNNKLFLGFLNSFFFSLPVSANHLIAVRRLLIQGIPAGIAAGLGLVLGYWWFVTSVVFGLRFVTIPWFLCEPFPFVIGLYLTTNVIYDMSVQRSLSLIKLSERSKLIRIFLLSFFLCWTEQACVFQSFINFNVDPNSSPLELYSSNFFLPQLTYSIGFLIGSVLFTYLFGLSLLWLFRFIPTRLGLFFSRWVNLFNFGLISLIFAFAVTTIPYYGFDYLAIKPLGFLSQDKTWLKSRTVFSPDIDVIAKWIRQEEKTLKRRKTARPDLQPFQRTKYLRDRVQTKVYEENKFEGEYYAHTRNIRLFARVKLETFGKRVGVKLGRWVRNKLGTPLPAIKRALMRGFGLRAEALHRKLNQHIYRYKKPDWEKPKLFDSSKSRANPNPTRKQKRKRKAQDQVFRTDYGRACKNPSAFHEPLFQRYLRSRFYHNPIYKSLLNTQIDFFIDKQREQSGPLLPIALAPDVEASLVRKRFKLAGYFNTLRVFDNVNSWTAKEVNEFYRKDKKDKSDPVWTYNNKNHSSSAEDEIFSPFFRGAKSYATYVYNQQFKGTLRIVRRLFSLTLPRQNANETHNNTKKGNVLPEQTLKFDQPLFRNKDLVTRHEELPLEDTGTESVPEKTGFVGDQVKVEAEAERKVRRNVWGGADKMKIGNKIWSTKTPNLFMQFSDSTPLYAGWDQNGRRFVLTNSLLSTTVSGRVVRETTHVLVPFPTFQVSKWSREGKPKRNKKGTGTNLFKEKGGTDFKEACFTTRPLPSGTALPLPVAKPKPQFALKEPLLVRAKAITCPFTTWPVNRVMAINELFGEKSRTTNNPYQLFIQNSYNPAHYIIKREKESEAEKPIWDAIWMRRKPVWEPKSKERRPAWESNRKKAEALSRLKERGPRFKKVEAKKPVLKVKKKSFYKHKGRPLVGDSRKYSKRYKTPELVYSEYYLGSFSPYLKNRRVIPPSRGGSVWPGNQ